MWTGVTRSEVSDSARVAASCVLRPGCCCSCSGCFCCGGGFTGGSDCRCDRSAGIDWADRADAIGVYPFPGVFRLILGSTFPGVCRDCHLCCIPRVASLDDLASRKRAPALGGRASHRAGAGILRNVSYFKQISQVACDRGSRHTRGR